MRTNRAMVEGRLGILSNLTNVQYVIRFANEGYRVEAALTERDVSPRLKIGELMEWVDAAIKGAEEMRNGRMKMLTFFNEGTTETQDVSCGGEWQMLGRGIYVDNLKVAEWDGGYWVIATNNKRFRSFRIA